MKLTTSIALATRNGGRYLEEQLNSIKEQTLPPEEVIVCDDDSADNTKSILAEFQRKVSFPVKIHENKPALKSQKNFIKAISLCEGAIIKLCDQDNYWEPEYLERIIGLFESNPNLGLVITNAEVVDQNLKPLGFTLWEFSRFHKRLQKQLASSKPYRVMLKNNIGYGFTLAFKSHFTPFLLNFPELWSYDGWIAMTISGLAKVGLIREPLVKYRQHKQQQKPFRINKIKKKKGINISANQKNLLFEKDLFGAALSHYRKNHPNELRLLIEDLQSKISHTQKRLNLPSDRFRRSGIIFKEARKGNYHQYSNGNKTIIKDLLGID